MKNNNIIGLYILTTYVVTFLCSISASDGVNAVAQAVPSASAVLFIIFSKNSKVEIINTGILRVGYIKWYLIAIILPWLAIASSYMTAAFFGFLRFQLHLPWITFLYRFLLFIFMWSIVWAIGEEFGWRGYLQPKFIKLAGVRLGIFLTGIVWAFWHLIFIFWGGYYATGNTIINASLLLTTVVLMAFSIGWIRLKSTSIWPCVIFHSASNAAWQLWSYQFEIINPNAGYFSGEAGIFNIIFWSVCLIFIWNKIKGGNREGNSIVGIYDQGHSVR